MVRKIKLLIDTEIKVVKFKDVDYQFYDGDGFILLIKFSGSKFW